MDINFYKLARPLGVFSIIASAFTWWLDLAQLVHACPYCQTQRSVIGLLGVMLLIRKPGHVTNFIALVLGFYGAHVAAEQVFSNFMRSTWGQINIYLASAALIFIIAQVYVLISMQKERCA